MLLAATGCTMFGLFCALWICYYLLTGVRTIRHTTVGELNAQHAYAFEYGIKWSARRGLFKSGDLPTLAIPKGPGCQRTPTQETCVQVTSIAFLLAPKKLLKHIDDFGMHTPSPVYIPLQYGRDFRRMSLLHLITLDDLPTCTFQGGPEERRPFVLEPSNYKWAWFKQIFLLVRYTTTVTLAGTDNATVIRKVLRAPFFDSDCNAQALVDGIHH